MKGEHIACQNSAYGVKEIKSVNKICYHAKNIIKRWLDKIAKTLIS